jgi:hypothetical protein
MDLDKSACVYRRFGRVQSAIVVGHAEAIQIVVRQSAEKIPEHSVTNRRVGPFHKALSQKHCGFGPFLSARFWKIPRQILRFYYGRRRTEKELSLTY